MAANVPGAGLQRPQGASRGAQRNEAVGEQGGAALAAAWAVAGIHRVGRAYITPAAHGTGRGQDHEEMDTSGIEPGHVEMDGVCGRADAALSGGVEWRCDAEVDT